MSLDYYTAISIKCRVAVRVLELYSLIRAFLRGGHGDGDARNKGLGPVQTRKKYVKKKKKKKTKNEKEEESSIFVEKKSKIPNDIQNIKYLEEKN